MVGALDLVLIHQLLGEYGHCIDAADLERFSDLFVPDAVLDYTAVRAPRVLTGIDEILDYFRGANHPAAHHVTNIVVIETDGLVHVHSKFLVPFTRPTHTLHRWYGGDYHDVVARATGDSWRFTRKVCTPRWQFTAAPFDDTEIVEDRRTF
jgi:hypothetical protein